MGSGLHGSRTHYLLIQQTLGYDLWSALNRWATRPRMGHEVGHCILRWFKFNEQTPRCAGSATDLVYCQTVPDRWEIVTAFVSSIRGNLHFLLKPINIDMQHLGETVRYGSIMTGLGRDSDEQKCTSLELLHCMCVVKQFSTSWML